MAASGGDTVFSFGKHRGLTFQHVVENHKGYASWCLEQKHLRSQLKEFAAYVRKSGIDVCSSQGVPNSQGMPCSQSSLPTQPMEKAVSGGAAGNTAMSQPPASQPPASQQPVTKDPVAATPAAPVAAPAPTPAPAAAQPVQVMGMSCGRQAPDPVTPPSKPRQDQLTNLQATPAPAPALAAAPAPLSQAACASQLGATPGGREGQDAQAVSWSTNDKQLDLFVGESLEPPLLELFASLPATRRIAVARLLQARYATVRNFQAFAQKVLNTACQDSAATQEATQSLPSAVNGQADISQQPPMSQCQGYTQMAASQGMPQLSQGAPMGSQMSQLPTQATLGPVQQAPQMMQCMSGQMAPMQPAQAAMQPGLAVCPLPQNAQGMPMQQMQMQMQMQQQMQMQPVQMTPQAHGQMAMQLQPQGGWQVMQVNPAEAAAQMSPWARVLAHLESKGIAFADVKSCHIDTRRDILKEVFPREPLTRAQAEVEWMRARSQSMGQSSAPRPQPRTRSRSRDRATQGPPGGRPMGGAGLSYIMPH